MATVDVLGEEITHEEETRAIAQAYRDVFAAIDEAKLDSNVSVKLTALGLELSYDLCRENLLDVVRTAAGYGNFVRIDMEDSSTTDDTLRLYRELREDGHENLGVVLQARLRRTLDDVHALADLRPSVRICKGIYLEPGTIAFTDYEAVRANFLRCLDALLDAGCYVGVATHDEWLIGESLARISQRGLGPLEYELQMLLGVREERRDELVAEGHRLRVYVPFGEHWYGYSLRRLQENPAMAGTIAKATAGRVLRLGAGDLGAGRGLPGHARRRARAARPDGRLRRRGARPPQPAHPRGVARAGGRARARGSRRRRGDGAPARGAAAAGEARRDGGGRGRDRAPDGAARDRAAGHRRLRRRLPRHRAARARRDGLRAVSRAVRAVAAGPGAPASRTARIPARCPRTPAA